MRKAAHAVLFLCLCLAGSAYGLGLGGELQARSALNQPLDAELALYLAADEAADEVRVRLADPDTYRRLGLPYHDGLPPLSFLVTHNAAGAPVIRIASRQPVREPALELLLEVSWKGGQMVRGYALLLDPPALYRPPATAPQPAPAPAAAPTAPAAPAAAVRESYGPVQRGETLSQIAQRLKPDSVGTPQMTVALFEANPHAFIGGNMNRLRWGVTLYMPSAEALTARSRGAAGRLMLQQQQALQAGEGEAAAAAAEEVPAALPQAAAAGTAPRLQLLAPVPADAPAGELQESLAQVRQLNQAVEVENEELRLRLAALEEQAQRMARQVLALPEPPVAEPVVPAAPAAAAEPAAPVAIPAPAPLAVPAAAPPADDAWWRNPSWWVVVLGILLAVSAVLVGLLLWRRNQRWEYRDLAQALCDDAEAKERARQALLEKARRRYN